MQELECLLHTSYLYNPLIHRLLKVESLEAMVAECIERLGGIKDKPIAASFIEALDAIAEANNSEAWAEAEMFEKFKKALQGE